MANRWVQKRRIGAAMAAGLIVLAACGTSSSEPPTTTDPITTATTTQTTTTTTEPTTTSTTTAPDTTETTLGSGVLLPKPVEDPELLTAVDAPAPEANLEAETWPELLVVWEQIDAYWTWLYSHPTESGAADSGIFHPGGPELEQQTGALNSLVENDLRLVTPGVIGTVTAFSCCPDPNIQLEAGRIQVAVQSRVDDGSGLFVNPDGSVDSEVPGFELATWSLELRTLEDGTWTVWLLERS